MGSLKSSWLSNTLSDFSCLVSCVKMWLCSVNGCSNWLDKDPEKHNLLFKNRKLTKKWVLSSRTGTQELIQKAKQYITANQRLLNNINIITVIPLCTCTRGKSQKEVGPASLGCIFFLTTSTLVMNTSQTIVAKSVTDTMLFQQYSKGLLKGCDKKMEIVRNFECKLCN